jgi:AraC family transcriptional regulator
MTAPQFAPSTLGVSLNALMLSDFEVRLARYDAGVRLHRHSHEHASLTMVLRGGVTEQYTSVTQQCRLGTVLIKPAEIAHSNEYALAPTECILVAVVDRDSLTYSSPRLFDDVSSIRSPRVASLAGSIARELRTPDAVSPMAIQGMLLEVLALGVRGKERISAGSPPKWAAALRDYLNDHWSQSVRSGDVARVAGVHHHHATRVFRRHYGCTPAQYLRRVRLERSIEALLDTNLPFATIAAQAGFSDQSHFTRVISAHVGCTPGELRQRR